MLAAHYADIRLVHIACAALSGALFTFRGVLHIGNHGLAHHRALRGASYVIDTTLLLAAILLMLIVHQYPFVNGWLTAKVGLLVLYIFLGTVTLKRAHTTRGRSIALAGALCAFAAIVAVAVWHHLGGG